MKHLKILLAFCLFLTLAACSDDDNSTNTNPTPDANKPIVPLAVGNEWVYIKHTEDSQDVFTVKLKNTELIDTTTCFYMDNTYDIEFPEYYYLSSLGLNVREIGSEKFTTFFKYPCSVGSTYTAGTSDETVKVVSINDTVKVDAGTFVCIKYSFDYEKTIAGSYFHRVTVYHVCPGIGIVLKEFLTSEIKGQAVAMQYQAKLKSYSLK